MEKIYTQLTQLIGSTPLLELSAIERLENLECRLVAKIESFNPGGSIKDRTALAMIEAAEREGKISNGDLIIEPTSGNTGIGLAWITAIKGYRLILTMPETMSIERQRLLRAYGAEIVLTEGAEGMSGAIRKAIELKEKNPRSIILQQFENEANPIVHEKVTADEIWQDTDGNIDCFVAGVGTGGTISGIGRFLKRHKPDTEVVAVEPESSAVLSGGEAGFHKIQGIGAGFIPRNYDAHTVDRIVRVSNESAFNAARMLAKKEGLLVGISSGATLSAAIELAKNKCYKDKTIVVMLPDTGERYLSTEVFE